MRKMGGDQFRAYSAGSQPTGQPNPYALVVLRDHDIDTSFAQSKRWDVFAGDAAPQMDLIVTVCDNAAGETCPVWPGHPQVAHWGVADPAAIEADHEKIVAAFQTTYEEMMTRITALIAARPTAATIGDLARAIGQSEAG